MAVFPNIAALKASNASILNNGVADESITPDDHDGVNIDIIDTLNNLKQDTLDSGNNIKTVNSETIVGSGNLDVRSDYTATSTYNAKNFIQNKPILFPAINFVDGNATPPTAFTNDVYVLIDIGNGAVSASWDGASYGDWVINNGTSWVFQSPINGVLCHNKTTDTIWQYIDTAWFERISNATHTGEVTGATALTVDKTAITNKSVVTAVGTDYVLISDTSDSGNLKKSLVSDLGGVTDGDKGDVTVSASGATWTIDNDAVTFSKMQNIATLKILGRETAGSGNIEELAISSDLQILLGTLGLNTTPIYISDVTTVGLLDNTANWTAANYTGTAITGTLQGQKHYNSSYYFECVHDNIWIRILRS